MSEIKTIDITSLIGSERFPLNENDVYGLVETIGSQRIEAVKSANKLEDATFKYQIENGKVIEEAVIEMAEAQAYDKDAYSRAAKDPVINARYFNNWESKQFQTSTRRNEIRKVIANKGVGVDDFIASILESLTEGEGDYSYDKARALILNAPCKDYSEILGGGGKTPASVKGIIYAIRDMYNHLKSKNSDCTAKEFKSSTPEKDIRIALSTKLLNLFDVVELANVFNLSKEELFGKLVVIDADDLGLEYWYKVVCYDVKAMGEASRQYEFSQEEVARGLYMNHYLTIDKCYFYNPLFKACYLDVRAAAIDATDDLIETPTQYTITSTLTNCTSDNTAEKVNEFSQYVANITLSEGYVFDEQSTITITMGGSSIVDEAWDAENQRIFIPSVVGNLVITLTPSAEV